MVRRPNQVQPSPSKQPPAPAVAGTAPSMVPSPGRAEQRPTRVMPPIVADPIPNRGVAPQPPLPGNDPKLMAQPPKFTVPPTAIQTTPPPRAALPDVARPQPRARSPQELLPQAEQDPRGSPAEPARTPPGAPPVIRQPKVPVTQNVPSAAGGSGSGASSGSCSSPGPRARPAPVCTRDRQHPFRRGLQRRFSSPPPQGRRRLRRPRSRSQHRAPIRRGQRNKWHARYRGRTRWRASAPPRGVDCPRANRLCGSATPKSRPCPPLAQARRGIPTAHSAQA